MRGERNYRDYLDDILETIDKIDRFTKNMDFGSFSSDEKTFFAVVRGLEVIGEAVKNIPETVRDRNPDVPWSEIAGMRAKFIHAYFGVDVSVVWMTVMSDLPELKKGIINISE